MVEVRIKNENEKEKNVYIESGEYCISIIGNNAEDYARVTVCGNTSLIDFAEAAGSCLRDVLKGMAKNFDNPLKAELVAMDRFAVNFYDNNREAPIDLVESNGRKDNNTI